MSFTKPVRVVDLELLETVRKLYCLCCLKTPCDSHHVRSRGAGGGDTWDNVMPLCSEHHRLWHLKGQAFMAKEFPAVLHWLEMAEA